MKTKLERQHYADMLARRLSAVVAEEAPRGMGHNEEYWDILEGLDRRLMIAAREFEDGLVTRSRLDTASVNYLHAFRRQIKQFHRQVAA